MNWFIHHIHVSVAGNPHPSLIYLRGPRHSPLNHNTNMAEFRATRDAAALRKAVPAQLRTSFVYRVPI